MKNMIMSFKSVFVMPRMTHWADAMHQVVIDSINQCASHHVFEHDEKVTSYIGGEDKVEDDIMINVIDMVHSSSTISIPLQC